eukprot:COSAG02_NODE_8419_length_2578_cov_1.135135_1_plen_299_part_00
MLTFSSRLQDAVRRRVSDEAFSLVSVVSGHFRQGALGGQQEVEGREHGITQAFEALKIYRATVERIGAKTTLIQPFQASPSNDSEASAASALPRSAADTDERRAELEVLEANAEFYAAIREGSLDRLGRICQQTSTPWGQPGCIHPARGLIQGWGRIAASWDQIFQASEAQDGGVATAAAAVRLAIGLVPETVQVNLPPGSNVAWVTGVEVFGGDEEGKLPQGDSFESGATTVGEHEGMGQEGGFAPSAAVGNGEIDSMQVVTFEDEDGEVIEEWGTYALLETQLSMRCVAHVADGDN